MGENELVSWERSMLAAVREGKSVYGHKAEGLAQAESVHLASQRVFQSEKPEPSSFDKYSKGDLEIQVLPFQHSHREAFIKLHKSWGGQSRSQCCVCPTYF